MLPPAAVWLWLLGSLLLYFPGSANGQLSQNDAWVRKYRCDGRSWTNITLGTTPFWVNYLRGRLDTVNASTEFSVSVSIMYDTALFSCEELDLATLEKSLGFKVLGKNTGRVMRFNSTCPLPMIPNLKPPEGIRFMTFDVHYQLEQAHKLQTLAAEYQFQTTDKQVLDCAAVKITPYIGNLYAFVFNLVPAGVMALVGAAAWQTHAAELGTDHLMDFSSALAGHQNPILETVMDVGVYLRYLQFVFLSSSLSLDYPGFLPPIVSNVAWSSLMFWRGPYDGGRTWVGVDQGMYVSNSTFGMDYMVRMLGFPRIEDFMFDAFLNLAILMGGLLAAFCVADMLLSKWNSRPSTLRSTQTRTMAYMSVTICLSLFSMPLLAYMSNDLMLMGYLPNYRVSLIALTMLILVYVHYVITRPFLFQRRPTALADEIPPISTRNTHFQRALQSISSYIPHFMPLLQAIIVGALQGSGHVQAIVLLAAEASILLHTSIYRNTPFRFSRFETAFLCVFRLIACFLLIPIVLFMDETVKQWIGYVLLCLHGIVIIPAFVVMSIRRLYLASQKGRYKNRPAPGRHVGHPDTQPGINIDDLNSSFMRHHGTYERLNESNKSSKSSNVNKLRPQVVSPGVAASLGGRTRRGSHLIAGPSATRDSQDNGQTRDFYRKPRTRPSHSATWHSSSTLSHSSCSSGRDGPSSAAHSLGSGSEQDISLPDSSTQYLSHANNDQPESSPKVDYSFREADLFYGVVPDEASTRDTPDSAGACNTSSEPAATPETGTGAESRNQTQWWRPKFSTTWTRKLPLLVQPAPKEEGFQVVRPGNAAFRMARMKQAQAQAQAMHSDRGEGQNSHAPSDTLSSDGVSDESVSRDTR